jgi:hypothetical protein
MQVERLFLYLEIAEFEINLLQEYALICSQNGTKLHADKMLAEAYKA